MSRDAEFFQRCVGRRGRKAGSLKRRARSHVFRGEKKYTPLQREAQFKVKRYKTHQLLTTFSTSDVQSLHCRRQEHVSQSKYTKKKRLRTIVGNSDVQNSHAAVARRAFQSQNPQETAAPGLLFLEVQMWKNCAPPCSEKQLSKSKCTIT